MSGGSSSAGALVGQGKHVGAHCPFGPPLAFLWRQDSLRVHEASEALTEAVPGASGHLTAGVPAMGGQPADTAPALPIVLGGHRPEAAASNAAM